MNAAPQDKFPRCPTHRDKTYQTPCPYCMGDWIVNITNAYARRDWEQVRRMFETTIQQSGIPRKTTTDRR